MDKDDSVLRIFLQAIYKQDYKERYDSLFLLEFWMDDVRNTEGIS